MNTCRECGVELIDGDNWKRRKKRTYLCKPCDVANTRRLRNEKKRKAVEYLGGKCMKCGGEFPPYVYDFHHRDPSEKDTSIGTLCSRTWLKVLKELQKCDLLCSNCHRIEHYGTDD